MTFEPLLSSPLIVQAHVLGATLSLLLGPAALLRKSRDTWHRALGYVWALAMAATAITSFWINSLRLIGPFGPIHVLSVYVLWSLWQGIGQARRGQITKHRATMVGLYFWGLCITGLLTLTPGRRMNDVVLGGSSLLGVVVPTVASIVLLLTVYRKNVLPLGKIGDRH